MHGTAKREDLFKQVALAKTHCVPLSLSVASVKITTAKKL